VQPPLAARVDQAVSHQRLQHVQPACPLPRYRQTRRPEVIQPELIPHMAGQPAGPPLPWPMQPQPAELDMHHIAVQRRCRTILRKQRDLSGLLAALVLETSRQARGISSRVLLLHPAELRPPPPYGSGARDVERGIGGTEATQDDHRLPAGAGTCGADPATAQGSLANGGWCWPGRCGSHPGRRQSRSAVAIACWRHTRGGPILWPAPGPR
jgi:hypothetical protein